MTDRAVSEVLGFVFVFTLVVGMVGVVYATGLSGLSDAQQAEKVGNVERAFDVLADNLEDLHQRGAPSRATEVKLAGGSLRTGAPVTVRIRAERATDPLVNATYTVNIQPIVYEQEGGTALVYANGAVLRQQPAGSAMIGEPGWVLGADRSVVPVVNTYGSDGGIAGEGTALIVAERRAETLQVPTLGGTLLVNVTVDSPRASAWKQFLEERGMTAVDSNADDGSVTYQFATDQLYVPRTDIEVTFDR